MTRPLLVLGIALTLARPAQAQTATLSGSVLDESGASVPGATVQLTCPGVRASTISGPHGEYSFKNLTEGSYQVTVSLDGFSQATRDNVVVTGGHVEVPPIALALAKLTETVIVSASKVEDTLINAPATMSVVTSDVIKTT